MSGESGFIPLDQVLREGKKKRRTAYQSGRRDQIGFDLPKLKLKTGLKPAWKDKPGRKLIARTPYASKTRWREW